MNSLQKVLRNLGIMSKICFLCVQQSSMLHKQFQNLLRALKSQLTASLKGSENQLQSYTAPDNTLCPADRVTVPQPAAAEPNVPNSLPPRSLKPVPLPSSQPERIWAVPASQCFVHVSLNDRSQATVLAVFSTVESAFLVSVLEYAG